MHSAVSGLKLRGAILLIAAPGLFAGAGSVLAADEEPVPVTGKAVDEKVASIVAYLWKHQNKEGHWDRIPDRTRPRPKPKVKPDPRRALHGNRGGTTALALLALIAAGEDEQDPRFQKALRWLAEQPWQGTYFRGLRATLYGQLKDTKYRKLLREDAKLLLGSVNGVDGMYSYNPPLGEQAKARGGDFSNTQYGVLGMWSAADKDIEIPQKYWQLVESAYLNSLTKDGGWSYHYGGTSYGKRLNAYGSMTAAGLASVFVIWEKLYIANDRNCRGRANPELLKAIGKGLTWMGKNFSAAKNPGRAGYVYYYLYSLERVGVASGLKYFGNHDWYKEVTWNLLNKKLKPYGLHDMSWTLLFLSYGRAPVAFNKLRLGRGWNEHPRDYAMLCRYLSRTFERHHNWQIMPIEAKQEEFHDAPILAFSSRRPFTLKSAEAEKIRTYLHRGGLLFVEAIGNSTAVGVSVRRLCEQMFPGLELGRLSPEHPIYRSHSHLANGQPELLGLSDGVRTLVVFCPRELSCDWQRMNVVKGKQAFEFGCNLVQYASDGGQLWSKEESYWPADAGRKPTQEIKVGRVVHGGEKAEHVWNPSGGSGWTRLDILSRNGGGPGIVTERMDLSGPVESGRVPVLHLTGVGGVSLSDQAKKHLKGYVESGGLLLADAAGGDGRFVEEFTKLCGELFGAGSLVPPPASELPFVGAVSRGGKVWYRHRHNLPRSLRPLEVLGVKVKQMSGGGRWGVLFFPYDVSYGMVGSPASEPSGLDPSVASELVLALLRWRTGRGKAPPAAPKPASP